MRLVGGHRRSGAASRSSESCPAGTGAPGAPPVASRARPAPRALRQVVPALQLAVEPGQAGRALPGRGRVELCGPARNGRRPARGSESLSSSSSPGAAPPRPRLARRGSCPRRRGGQPPRGPRWPPPAAQGGARTRGRAGSSRKAGHSARKAISGFCSRRRAPPPASRRGPCARAGRAARGPHLHHRGVLLPGRAGLVGRSRAAAARALARVRAGSSAPGARWPQA